MAVPADALTLEGQPLVDRQLVKTWFGFALFWTILAPVFGLFSTGILGFMTYAVPKLCGRPLANIRAA